MQDPKLFQDQWPVAGRGSWLANWLSRGHRAMDRCAVSTNETENISKVEAPDAVVEAVARFVREDRRVVPCLIPATAATETAGDPLPR